LVLIVFCVSLAIKTYKQGEALFQPSMQPDDLLQLVSGTLKVEKAGIELGTLSAYVCFTYCIFSWFSSVFFFALF
jgi:hypothetical protein